MSHCEATQAAGPHFICILSYIVLYCLILSTYCHILSHIVYVLSTYCHLSSHIVYILSHFVSILSHFDFRLNIVCILSHIYCLLSPVIDRGQNYSRGATFKPGPGVLILAGAGAVDFWSRFGAHSDLLKL